MSKPIFISNALDDGEVSAEIEGGKLEIFLGSISKTLTKRESERFATVLNAEILEPMRQRIQKRRAAFDKYQQREPGATWYTFLAGWEAAEENNE